MVLPRWTIGCVALAGLLSGCSDSSESSPRLYPILNDRGFITYTYDEPQAETTPKPTAPQVRVPVIVAQTQPDPQAEEKANQYRLEQQRILAEREARERQERDAIIRETHQADVETLIWHRQQERAALSSVASGGRSKVRGSRSVDSSDAIQSRATSLYLDREAVRLRQEELNLRPGSAGYSNLDNRPVPLLIP